MLLEFDLLYLSVHKFILARHVLSLGGPCSTSTGSFLDPDLDELLVVPSCDQHYLVVLRSTLRFDLDTFVELFAFHNYRLVPSCVRPCCNLIEL